LVEILRKKVELRTLIHLGSVNFHLGEYHKAISYLNEAIRIGKVGEKDYEDAMFNKGITLKQMKKYEDALDCFNIIFQYGDKDPSLNKYFGDIFLNFREYKKALEFYEKFSTIDPYSLNGISICHLLLNESDNANYYVNKSLELFGINDDVGNLLYERISKFTIQHKKIVVEAIIIKSLISRNIDEKNKLLDLSIEISSRYFLDLTGPYFLKSVLLINEEKYEEARNVLSKILKLNENFLEVLYLLGVCYYNLNRIDESLEYFKKSLAIDPNFALSRMAENQINMKKKKNAIASQGIFDHWLKKPTFVFIFVSLLMILSGLTLYSIVPNQWNNYNLATNNNISYNYSIIDNGIEKEVSENIENKPADNRQIILAIIIGIIVIIIWPSVKSLRIGPSNFEVEKNDLTIPEDNKIIMSWIKIEEFALDLNPPYG